VDGGRIAAVELSGDFFLEPDEALGWMTGALAGMPADAPAEEIAARVAAACAGAELLGITPAGVAEAVRRAVEGGRHA
jgi:lipoate-protein ligase A